MTLRVKGGIAVAAVIAVAVPMGAYYEGVFPQGYADAVGIPTECIGETGPDVKVGVQRYTWDECVARYPIRLQRVWDSLSRCMDGEVTVGQGGAMVSWADNVGTHAACTSTLARLVNAGADGDVWCHQLTRWDKATMLGAKIVLPGLTKRRASEVKMCLGTDWRTGHPLADFSNVTNGKD